ncbi:hypothetical protein NKR19_g7188 [Coniochaeta hoffmannii]|uniref:U4/U6.U5 small nuclear ribonucleoprotein 27kDa protein domain-containing protein n=1 Tax=Coniochaeta hoffmannii TaxID=91930 RepID=A0AA38RNR5_9PEZI|nr:hypothetical protein NKR19_g7188 [Coniochaeta hoffmannii]
MADRHQRSSHRDGGRRDRPRGDGCDNRRDDDRDSSRRYRSRSPRDRPERPDRRKRDYDDARKPRDDTDRAPRDAPRHRDEGRDRPKDRDGRKDRDREDGRKARDGGKDRVAERDRRAERIRDREEKAVLKADADVPPKPPADQPPPRHRTASPKRPSASPRREPSEDRELELPSRRRKEKSGTPAAHPVHIKLGKHDGDTIGQSSLRHETSDERPAIGDYHGPTPMDEDEPEDDVVVETDGLDDMQAMMGFGSFGTTKGKKIPGNNVGAVRKEKKTEYRQYMNRVGGFNRPLDQI